MVRKKGAAAGASKAAAKSAKRKAKAAKKTEKKEKKQKVHADSDVDSDDDLEATLDKVCFFHIITIQGFLYINDNRCGGNGRKLMQSLKRQSRVRPAVGPTGHLPPAQMGTTCGLLGENFSVRMEKPYVSIISQSSTPDVRWTAFL